MNLEEFGKKALELACHYQNRCCEQEEIIEMFCLDAAAAQAITQRAVLIASNSITAQQGGEPCQ